MTRGITLLAAVMMAAATTTTLGGERVTASATAADRGIRPADTRWDMAEGLSNDALDISGVACAPDRLLCVLVSDETRYVRFFRMENQKLVPEKRELKLLPDNIEPGKGKKLDEADAEAVDYEEGYFYVAGSHSRSRKNNEERPARAFIYRIPVDLKNRREAGPPERSANLRDALKELPEFRGREINIEGMSARAGKIFLGFREPVVNGSAYVVETTLARVFGTSRDKLVPHAIKLSGASGIRDLVKVSEGFLILAGPEQDVLGSAYVHFWPGSGADAQLLGELPKPKDPNAKPEALLVLGEDPREYRVLVMSDGVSGGEPTEYVITKARTRNAR